MNHLLKNFLYACLVGFLLANCANKGRPEGGPIDEEPPVITRSEPKNYSTNFTSKEIKIYFDEYVKVKNIQKQLIISPPMDPQPDIIPMGNASKYISITITDTLSPNTTYAINFGNSIVDNNEENPYPYYRYVFSTGDYIDSLSVEGNIIDAELLEPDNFVSVMLYEMDSTYTDSIIYNKPPRYITNTLDSLTTFKIENIKAGKYMLYAVKDENQDNKFQQHTDKIAFRKTPITIPSDTTYTLKLFKERLDDKVIRPRLVSGERIAFGFQGSYEDIKINVQSDVPDDYDYRITKNPKTDSLDYWYKPRLEVDSLLFQVSNKNYTEDFTVKISEQPRDTMVVKAISKSTLPFNDDYEVSSSTPFFKIDKEKLTFMDKDSLPVEYSLKLDTLSNTLSFIFDKTESNTYKIEALPEAFTDFFGDTNDSLSFSFNTKTLADYSNVRVRLNGAKFPVIVQLTTDKGEVKYEQYATEPKPVDFKSIDAGNYRLRVIYDTNGNGKYDTGNVLNKQQPEEIIYSTEIIESNANWDIISDFKLPN